MDDEMHFGNNRNLRVNYFEKTVMFLVTSSNIPNVYLRQVQNDQ